MLALWHKGLHRIVAVFQKRLANSQAAVYTSIHNARIALKRDTDGYAATHAGRSHNIIERQNHEEQIERVSLRDANWRNMRADDHADRNGGERR